MTYNEIEYEEMMYELNAEYDRWDGHRMDAADDLACEVAYAENERLEWVSFIIEADPMGLEQIAVEERKAAERAAVIADPIPF